MPDVEPVQRLADDAGVSRTPDGQDGSRTAGAPRGGAPGAAEQLSTLTHELRGLLDGSLRWIRLAMRGLDVSGVRPGEEEIERTRRQIETVSAALERMAELVGATAGGPLRRAAGAGATLLESAEHAAEVVRPVAFDSGVRVLVEVDDRVGRLPAGPMYSVMLNGLRNALESVEEALGAGDAPGEGLIVLRVSGDDRELRMEIEDDGAGPPEVPAGSTAFDHGFSTRCGAAGDRGLGLAIARGVLEELGGRIELVRGTGPERERPGAVLRAAWPRPIEEAA
ncbi:MAG: HAMP domain-containing sensor histidine kinase [Planctomycetota bacterium]